MATVKRKDYAAIGLARITSPTKMSAAPPRILVYGRNKKGKTTFCTTPGKGKVLIADPEDGTARMVRRDPDVWPVRKWEDLDELYNFLRLGKHTYEWAAIDGLTRMHHMALRFVMNMAAERSLDTKPSLVHPRHYGQAGELTKEMLWQFHQLPIGIVYTAQERMVDSSGSGDEDEESEEVAAQFVPDLPKGARASLNSIVDVIGRIYTVKAPSTKDPEKEVIQRRLWLEPHPSYDTGYRSDYASIMPQYLKNPTISRLVQLMMEGTTSARQ
jgi:hypothetical protein